MIEIKEFETAKIAIWGVSNTFGGIQMLLIRLADFLESRAVDFKIVTRKNSRLSKEIANSNQIHLEDVYEESHGFTHLLLPNISNIRDEIPWREFEKCKVSVWLVHPTEIFSSFFPGSDYFLSTFGFRAESFISAIYRERKRRLQNIIEYLIYEKSLFCMDGATKNSIYSFFPDVGNEKVRIVPIPSRVQGSRIESKVNLNIADCLSVGYFGRIDDFKMSALKPFLTHNIKGLGYKEIILHVVGEGPSFKELSVICSDLGINLIFHGFQENSVGVNIIKKHTHFAACMGTAALDIADTSHPCIIIDPAIDRKSHHQNLFKFVHEIEEFTLGEYRDSILYQEKGRTIRHVIDAIRSDPFIGEKAQRYVRKCHNPDTVFEELLIVMSMSSAKIEFLQHLIEQLNNKPATGLKLFSRALKKTF